MKKEPKKEALSSETLDSLIIEKKGMIQALTELLEKEKQGLERLEALRTSKPSTIALHGLPPDVPPFDRSWTWTKKLIFTVRYKDRPLLSPEIIKTMEEIQPGIFRGYNAVNVVSVYLTQIIKNKRLIRYKLHGQKGFYYCHPTWFNDKEELKQEYLSKITAI
jgi:hypothetical protein